MEKNRWSLIFIGLCLALVFSVSPVEAQMHHLCEPGTFCDQDGDDFYRDHQRCAHCEGIRPVLDCDDHDGSVPDPDTFSCEPEPEPEPGTVEICHFKNRLNHCVIDGNFVGGSLRTISDDDATVARHFDHGDCIGVGSFANEPIGDDNNICVNHCVALPLGTITCAP